MKSLNKNFFDAGKDYRDFRPILPPGIAVELSQLAPANNRCLDCGTGNGQFAVQLAAHFNHVDAIDVSLSQLEAAVKNDKIHYLGSRAEETPFEADVFDLVTAVQAFHWFDSERFFKEVKRILKPDGILFLGGYSLIKGSDKFNSLLQDLYTNTLGPFWDPERKIIEAEYQNTSFPFEVLHLNTSYTIQALWSPDELQGYLQSWSSVRKYINEKGEDPIVPFMKALKDTDPQTYSFSVFYKVGRLKK
ncbi:class I SAM-dependent methyltransferase [Robertkochia solimangrovi]|uniref:class I SAM-dependent methyltransferase n=1 Tax=Robertkochia solimangrovi TaxID=2213046 RepID=UPI0013A57CDA|nr:class I SAM-dependent methyltransferase [Robertkochia solimangrovi]